MLHDFSVGEHSAAPLKLNTLATVVIDSDATAKEILAAIEQWAHDHEPWDNMAEVNNLWSVLTALRGPDDGDLDVKEATTAVIRGASVPSLASRGGAYAVQGNLQTAREFAVEHFRDEGGSTHFFSHVRRAIDALL